MATIHLSSEITPLLSAFCTSHLAISHHASALPFIFQRQAIKPPNIPLCSAFYNVHGLVDLERLCRNCYGNESIAGSEVETF